MFLRLLRSCIYLPGLPSPDGPTFTMQSDSGIQRLLLNDRWQGSLYLTVWIILVNIWKWIVLTIQTQSSKSCCQPAFLRLSAHLWLQSPQWWAIIGPVSEHVPTERRDPHCWDKEILIAQVQLSSVFWHSLMGTFHGRSDSFLPLSGQAKSSRVTAGRQTV